ncbi:MAG: hypothetical protein WBA22_11370 [Candidatus Methanofastidiosia archaeon]
MIWLKNSFGLGYFENGQLTHHVWFNTEKVECGPYNVKWMAFQTYQQFCELMALIKTLEDQVHLVTLREPPSIQVQDLLESPFRIRQLTEKSVYHPRSYRYRYTCCSRCFLLQTARWHRSMSQLQVFTH